MNPSESSSNSATDIESESEVEQIVEEIVTKLKWRLLKKNQMLRKQLNQKKVKLTNADDAIKDKPKRMKKVELPDA